ncbi:MAG: hypothetical protein KAT35_02120, partial [Candidatus Aenigmarchaeota archaeon]|nr:hypothetical protein [Candidatus Aenigmarchaeota archaeon]
LIIHLGGRLREKRWFWFFVGGYYVIGWILSVWGGKMEAVTNTLTLLSILLYKKGDWGKANFLLGFAVQMKVYPLLLLPYYIFKTKKHSLWFFVSLVFVGLILPLASGVFSGLTMHASNDFRYSIYVTNSLFFGFIFSNPLSAITLALFIAYIIPTLSQVKKKENIYLILLPAVFFVFRWMMAWYFFWPIPLAMVMDNEEDMKKYIKTLCVVVLLYCLGILINIDYYLTANLLYDFLGHFSLENL